jgi:hypothetical protein
MVETTVIAVLLGSDSKRIAETGRASGFDGVNVAVGAIASASGLMGSQPQYEVLGYGWSGSAGAKYFILRL